MREVLIHIDNGVVFTDNDFSKQLPVNKQRRISELLDYSSDKCFSVEICANRYLNLELLKKVNASFCSITWHNSSNPLSTPTGQIPAVILARQLSCQGFNVLLHLAGRNLKRYQALKILHVVKDLGVKNIFALQGDQSPISNDEPDCHFPYAIDLVRFIRANFGNYFCIGVAGYPEKHPASKNIQEDIKRLQEKVRSGADYIITQASYDFKAFQRFSKLCKTMGIHVPIVPGIFIISSYKSLIAMSKLCSVPISQEVMSIVLNNKNNSDAVKEFGIYHATLLVKYILSSSNCLFRGFHIFSINNIGLVREVLKRLGIYKPYLEYPI